MSRPGTGSSSQTAQTAGGRRDLEATLARYGVRRGPRPAGTVVDWAGLLGELGPITAELGRYLSRRVDLYGTVDEAGRLALSRLEPEPFSYDVDAILRHAFADSAIDHASFQVAAQPERVDWSGAWFRAVYTSADGGGAGEQGDRIRLWLPRPDLDSQVERAAESLAGLVELGALPGSVIEDFFDVVRRRLDPGLRSAVFALSKERPGAGSALGPDWVVPAIVPELCAGRVLAVEDSARAHGVLAGGPMRSRGPVAARLLCSHFVELLAERGLLACDLQLARLQDGRAYVLDASIVELRSPYGERVLDFLRATAGERPRDIVDLWRREIESQTSEASRQMALDRLRSKLRQATPRRAGTAFVGETTAEYAVAYWRAAAEAGVRLSPPWRQALLAIDGLRRRLADWDCEGDALSDALVEHSWRQGWNRLRSMATPQRLGRVADRYAASLIELPQLLDRMLDLPDRTRASRSSPRAPRSRIRSRRASTLPLVLGLASISLVAHHFGHIAPVEPLATVLFVALAVALLISWRRR